MKKEPSEDDALATLLKVKPTADSSAEKPRTSKDVRGLMDMAEIIRERERDAGR